MRSRLRPIGAHALVGAGFGVLSMALTWPLALRLPMHIPGEGAGDNFQFLWNYWWMRYALGSPEHGFFETTFLFYPAGFDLVLHTHTALTAFAGATLLSGLPLVTALNATIISAVALNGVCAYLLAWHVTRHRPAAIVAGLFFASSPYFVAHLRGHFNLLAGWTLPLFAFFFLQVTARSSWTAAVAAGVVMAVTVYNDYYYALYAATFGIVTLTALYVSVQVRRASSARHHTGTDRMLLAGISVAVLAALVIWRTGGGVLTLGNLTVSMTSGRNLRFVIWVLALVWLWRRWRPRLRVSWRARPRRQEFTFIVTAAVVFLVTAAPLLWQAMRVWSAGDYVSHRYLWRSAPAGIDAASLIVGSPFHPLWGALVERVYQAAGMNPIEGIAWLGAAPMLLLIVTRRQWTARTEATLWSVCAGLFLLWSLGPRLQVFGFDTGLVLPQSLLRFVPLAANARIPGRAIVMVYLAVAVLLAIAVAHAPFTRKKRLAAAVGTALLVDFCGIPTPLFPVDRPGIYQTLAELPPGAVCELPFGVRDGFGEEGLVDHRVLYYQSLHEKPMVGGFGARLPDRVKRQYDEIAVLDSLLRLSGGEPVLGPDPLADRDTAATQLRRHNIRYFILNRATASDALARHVTTALPVRLMTREGTRELYVLVD